MQSKDIHRTTNNTEFSAFMKAHPDMSMSQAIYSIINRKYHENGAKGISFLLELSDKDLYKEIDYARNREEE